MCGLTGIWQPNGFSASDEQAMAMAHRIIHRGPDDCGVWTDTDAGLVLAHRRLSILDLSPAGHQPMMSASGQYVISFNGEIYNIPELKKELEKSGASDVWRGHSDTEVMLAVIAHWGLVTAVKRFVGMFAFALWDREDRTLHLVRDRMGEKPLYYGWVGKTFLFGSELKALRAYPGWCGEIDCNALTLCMRHDHIPAPHTIYQGSTSCCRERSLACPGMLSVLPRSRADPLHTGP